MAANDSFHIAVIPGDGIGPEVMAPALDVLPAVSAATPGLAFRFSEAPAGAGHYVATGALKPCEFGGRDGTAAVSRAVLAAL